MSRDIIEIEEIIEKSIIEIESNEIVIKGIGGLSASTTLVVNIPTIDVLNGVVYGIVTDKDAAELFFASLHIEDIEELHITNYLSESAIKTIMDNCSHCNKFLTNNRS